MTYKKVTAKWLRGKSACTTDEYNVEIVKKCEGNSIKIIKHLISIDRFDYANWFIARYMNKKQKIQYAIFAAKLVLFIFEKKYPNDIRPRKAIEAAEKYLKNPCKKTKIAYSAYSASSAAYSAADSAYSAADDAKKKTQVKIIKNGIKILKEEK